MADSGSGSGGAMRIDRFLWFARLTKTRTAAQALASAGGLRLDGRRIDRAHVPVRVGSVIAFMQADRVRIVRICALPIRRGPPGEAQAMYDDLSNPVDEPGSSA
ncbi:MAG: RNA-binding S4 domain-containing protein [Sphingomonas sp.]|nr:RNA-binding S4 domain-containing protein [Sphingomonas sp.]